MYCLCLTILSFACADDSFLSLARGRPHVCEFFCKQYVFCVCGRRFGPRGQRARLDSDMCAEIDRSTCLVEPYYSLSCFPHVWHHLLGCLSRLFFVTLGSLSAFLFALRLRPSCSCGKDCSVLHLLGLLILSLSVSSWIMGTCLRMLLGTICVSSWIIGTCVRMLLGTLATSSMTCT